MSFLPKTRFGLLWRAFLAAFLIVGFTAGATAVAGLLQVSNLADELAGHDLNIKQLVLPKPGAPETFLLIGSDHRAGSAKYLGSNTDTMLLVRIDDSSQTINMLSVPRDLDVLGPNGMPVKLNSIYESEGGPSGLLKVLKQQVFPGLAVNHVVDTNFVGFSDLINAIGCVYSDVDHRYYNVSALGANDYSSIDIEPGYQRLCGGVHSSTGKNSALAFVRFRHLDSDIVRNSRQQDFIRWAKDGYSAGQLLDNEGKLIKIFSDHTTTDTRLASTHALLNLFNLMVDADSHSLKTIKFPEYAGQCDAGGQTPCYVYPCPQLSTCAGGDYVGPNPPLGKPTEATEAAYREFMTPTRPPVPVSKPKVAPKKPAAPPKTKHVLVHHGPNLAGLIADTGDGASESGQLAGKNPVGPGGRTHFPIFFPRYIVNAPGSAYCMSLTGNCTGYNEPDSAYEHSYPRRYVIGAPGNHHYWAYVMTLVLNSAAGEYYTVQGTTWKNPPILNHVSKVVHIAGKTLDEYDDGSRIALVAYRTPRAVYWISNTLGNAIGNTQMIGMAAELTRFTGRT